MIRIFIYFEFIIYIKSFIYKYEVVYFFYIILLLLYYF